MTAPLPRVGNVRKGVFALPLLALLVAGCSGKPAFVNDDSAPSGRFDASGVPDAVPRAEPRSRYGNPKTYVVFGKEYRVMEDASGFRESGIASWYGTKFHGRRTSSGEPYDMYKMTAAHKSLPLPSYVRVTNKRNGKSVIVRVNDRGPFHDGRIIDLSYAAALKLDVVATGTAPVEIEVIDPERYVAAPPPSAKTIAERKVADGGLYIQLGAFSESRNALGLKSRLEGAGIRPVRVAEEMDRQLFRVRVGPFENADRADETALRLVALGINDFHIVTE